MPPISKMRMQSKTMVHLGELDEDVCDFGTRSEISVAELVKSSYGLASDMDEVWSDESQIP